MIPGWLTEPATILALVLFIISLIVSLYAPEIRRWIRKPGEKFNEWELDWARNRLAHLKLLHANTYQLVLYLAWEVAYAVRYSFYAGTILVLVGLALYAWHRFDVRWLPSIGGIVIGGLIGKVMKMYEVLEALYRYPTEAAKLEELIARIEKDASVRDAK